MPPPDDAPFTSTSAVSPVMANGWPYTLTFADDTCDDAGRSTAVVMRGARWHSCVLWDVANTLAVPPAGVQLAAPLSAMLGPTSAGVVLAIAQSLPVSTRPSRHRPDRTSTRLSRPLPADLAAMQKGKQGASCRPSRVSESQVFLEVTSRT
jgi:hypothetical protein